ncbi:MAG: hypothetical protein WB988_13055 [Candidatus Nitrosopolaris sp.]
MVERVRKVGGTTIRSIIHIGQLQHTATSNQLERHPQQDRPPQMVPLRSVAGIKDPVDGHYYRSHNHFFP